MVEVVLTKNDMARTIVQALYVMSKRPANDHPRVRRLCRRMSLEALKHSHRIAQLVLKENGL